MPSDEIIGSLKDSIVKGDKEESVALTKKAIESGLDTKVILNNGLIQATQIVGTLFEKMEYYLPDLIISADAMIGVMEIIKPHLEGDPNQK
ncbi:MAG: B12-binding domain-containing protein, partial [Candidatus Helarchaeota archaeon]|nr:B12-binding domain-containing protein [Candidatus Helarchaeota archaeon]